MLTATEGIVLHFIKYSESSVIATILTREFGRQSYMINASRSKKSKNKAGLLQPLFLLDMEVYQKQNRELQRVKSIKIKHPYQNLPFDITRSTQAIFLAEVLYKIVREQESNPEMFDFIKSALLYFDLMDGGSENFHLFFLLRLTEFLGFQPMLNSISFQGWFDMKKGAIVPFEPTHPFSANKETTKCLSELSKLKIHQLDGFRITRSLRESTLSALIDYYQLHFDSFRELKSLKVLHEVFS